MRTVRAVILTGMFALLWVAHGNAKSMRVSPSEGPFYTIQSAIDVMRSGDTVDIEAGEYLENVVIRDFGEFEKWSVIRSVGAGAVIINGSSDDQPAFYVENSQYLIIEGLHFTKAPKYGLAFFDSHHIIAKNCRSSFNVWEGFLSKNSSYTDFIDCVGHDNIHDSFNFNNARHSKMTGCLQYNGGNGLSIERGSENILVENNFFYDNWTDGILVYRDCADITIRGNTIYKVTFKNPHDNGQGHCMKITHRNRNVTVSNNQFANCAAAFSYEIADNTNVRYFDNEMINIGRRIPYHPRYSGVGDVLFKGPGDYADFIGCAWYN
ncbi:MAG: hypothetical protein EOM23_03750, partial [Candidatus Moranbacteria bacterium]|nr:hypothetical protein [Candidatus Moranbacteria bacterium]